MPLRPHRIDGTIASMSLDVRPHPLRFITIGMTGGLFSGLTGVGGGAIMVPLLTGLLRMPQHRAHGTSLAAIIFIASAGLVPYIVADEVDWGLAAGLGAGSVTAAVLSARVMARVSERLLRQIFAVFLLLVAVRMLFA